MTRMKYLVAAATLEPGFGGLLWLKGGGAR